MKKLFAIAAGLMLIGTTAFAQSFGAGYVQSTQKFNKTASTANGFYAGFGYTAEILPFLSLNPGIYYEFLTAKDGLSFGSLASVSGKTTEHYVNVPLQLSLSLPLAPTFKMFLYGGPTANIGIASTTKVTGRVLGFEGEESKVNNYEKGEYNRFDIMLGGGIGAEVAKRVRLTVGYDFGMLNRAKNSDDVLKRNRLTAGAAFIF